MKKNMKSTISPIAEGNIRKKSFNKEDKNISRIPDKDNKSKIIIEEDEIDKLSKNSKKRKIKPLKFPDTNINLGLETPGTDKPLILKDNKSSNQSEKEKNNNVNFANEVMETNQNLLETERNEKEKENTVKFERKCTRRKTKKLKSKKNFLLNSSSDSDDDEEEEDSESKKECNKKYYKAYYLTNLSMKLQQENEAVKYSDEMMMLCDEPLNKDQINIILAANSLYINKLRNSQRSLSKILIDEKGEKSIIKEIKKEKDNKIIERCKKFIKLINDYILIREYPKEAKALILKTKADYYRYLAEVTRDHELFVNKQNALHFYLEAKELTKDLDHLNSIKLGVALNYSVFLNEVMNKRINSYFAAKEAIFNALSDLKNCTEEELAAEEMRDTLMCIEILNRNVETWYSEEMEADNEESERKKRELIEKHELKNKGVKDGKENEGEEKDEQKIVEEEKEDNLNEADEENNLEDKKRAPRSRRYSKY